MTLTCAYARTCLPARRGRLARLILTADVRAYMKPLELPLDTTGELVLTRTYPRTAYRTSVCVRESLAERVVVVATRARGL